MRFEIVKSWEALKEFKPAWYELALRSSTNSIFQTFEWHEAWVRTFAPEVLIILGFEGDVLKIIAPLESFIDKRYGAALRLIGTGNYFSDYADLIYQSGDYKSLTLFARYLAASSWNQFDLFNLVQSSDTLKHLERSAKELNLLFFKRRLYSAPTSHLLDPKRTKEILNKESLKRHAKGLAKRGVVEFRHITNREEILSKLPIFFKQHQGRRGLVSDQSLFDLKENQCFYEELVRELNPDKQLRFSELTLNSVPIAFHFGFEFNKRLIWYKPSFDAALSRLSPGEVLIKNLFEYAIANNLSELDFGVGDESFKLRFADEIRSIYRVILFRKRSDLIVERVLLIGRRIKAAILDRLF